MLRSQTKTPKDLERAIARYETKLLRASNPTQRRYAAGMLRTARAALAKSREGEPDVVGEHDGIVTLGRDEYELV